MPDWATFVQVAVELGALPLTASRQSLQDSATLVQVRDEIGTQIRARIERLVLTNPEIFNAFVETRSYSLLAMATGDLRMLDFVARHYMGGFT